MATLDWAKPYDPTQLVAGQLGDRDHADNFTGIGEMGDVLAAKAAAGAQDATTDAPTTNNTAGSTAATAVPDELKQQYLERRDYLGRLIRDMESRVAESQRWSDADIAKMRRRNAARGIVTGIADVTSALANLWATNRYAPNSINPQMPTLTERMQARYDKELAERRADNERYDKLKERLANLKQQQQDNDLGWWQMQRKLQDDAEAKARQQKLDARQAEQWEHDKALRPLELRAKEANLDYYQARAIREAIKANYEPERLMAEIERICRGSRKGFTGRDGKKYYGTFNGQAYATKADYDKAVRKLVEQYGIATEEISDTYPHRATKRTTADMAAEAEAEAAKEKAAKAKAAKTQGQGGGQKFEQTAKGGTWAN